MGRLLLLGLRAFCLRIRRPSLFSKSNFPILFLKIYRTLQKTTISYAPGLFHSYDLPDLPRTNNARESDFRDLNRRLLRTTGQKGLTRRIIQRSGAWELLHRPASLKDTILAFNHIAQQDFMDERQRVHHHRDRFRLHTRSAKQSGLQLSKLEQRWANLSPS
jgi:hypothetical protein